MPFGQSCASPALHLLTNARLIGNKLCFKILLSKKQRLFLCLSKLLHHPKYTSVIKLCLNVDFIFVLNCLPAHTTNIFKCIFVHMDPCRSSILCATCLTEQINVDIRGRVIGDSFTTALAVHRNNNSTANQFCNLCMVLGVRSHLSVESLHVSHVFPPLFFSNSPFLLDDVQSA